MNQKIKISQLPAKGSNLAAQDLIEIAEFTGTGYISKSITGQEIIDAAVGNVDWGDIGGTLSAQTDLQNALDAKQDDITLTTTGSSGASTLVGATLNVPNYTLSGLGGVPTSRTLTINGVTQDLSANRTFTISTGITIGTTAITSGTVGRILFEGTGNVVQENSGLTWDNTNKIFQIYNATTTQIRLLTDFSSVQKYAFFQTIASTPTEIGSIANEFGNGMTLSSFNAMYFKPANTERMRLAPTTGNVLINTTTDAGFRLDVNGTARVQGVLTIGTELYLGNNNTGFFKSTNDFNFYNLANGSVKYRITGASQGFGISDNGYDTVAASAMLQVNSTTKGFLPPRMTTTQKNAIASPAAGLMVYDTTLNVISYYNGSMWI